MKTIAVCLCLLFSGCSFQAKPVLNNSYIPRMQELTLHGLDALHHGRFVSAQNLLQRALRSAWLSTDLMWVGRAQYHLGALYLAQNNHTLALPMFKAAQQHAVRTQDQYTQWRTDFALALLQQQTQHKTEQAQVHAPILHQDMPMDVYLTAARLAHLQGRLPDAKQAYHHLIAELDAENPETIYMLSQAYMGLALLARDAAQTADALALSTQVLVFAQQAGLSMLAAHATLLQGYLLDDVDKFKHAWRMYQALEDWQGQYDALQALFKHQPEQQKHRWQQALNVLGKR